MVDNWLSRLWALHNVITKETIILLSFSNEMLHFPQKNTNNCQEFSSLERIVLLCFYLKQTKQVLMPLLPLLVYCYWIICAFCLVPVYLMNENFIKIIILKADKYIKLNKWYECFNTDTFWCSKMPFN